MFLYLDYIMDAELPNYVTSSLNVLNKIWSRYRAEKISFPIPSVEPIQFRKNYLAWYTQNVCTDPRNGSSGTVHVMFTNTTQTLNTEFTTVLAAYASEHEYKHVLIVAQSMTKMTKPSLLKTQGIIWELLTYDDLKFCAPLNTLVPIKYEILSDTERSTFTMDVEKIRKMNARDDGSVKHHVKQDAMARLLGFRIGDVVRVTEANPYTGQNITYRHLV